MDKDKIERYILESFQDVHLVESWGEKSFFLNPGQRLKRGTYIATLKDKDGENDRASYLDRSGIFRLNIGVSKELYLSLFQNLPKRPAKGCCIAGDYNFQTIDTILPHPVYGWMGWVSVLNPSVETFNTCTCYLADAYSKAFETTRKKLSPR